MSDITPPNEHTHHWKIAAPDGPQSLGVCSGCGATRQFRNHLTTSVWEDFNGSSGFGNRKHSDFVPVNDVDGALRRGRGGR